MSGICFIYMKNATMPLYTAYTIYVIYNYMDLVYWRENKRDREQRCWNVKIPFALKWLNVTLFHAVLSRLSALFFGSGSPFFPLLLLLFVPFGFRRIVELALWHVVHQSNVLYIDFCLCHALGISFRQSTRPK